MDDPGSIPQRAKHMGRVYVVLAYEGNDRFLVQCGGEKPTTMHRRSLTFLRPVVKAGAALDDALDSLGTVAEDVSA